MNINGVSEGQIYLFIGIGILVILLIVIPIVSMRSARKAEKLSEKTDPALSTAKAPKVAETPKVVATPKVERAPKKETRSESRIRKTTPAAAEKEEGTRVVTSFTAREERSEGESEVTKSLTPAEAEFVLVMAWRPSVSNMRTCGWCGAEMEQSASGCSACGRRS